MMRFKEMLEIHIIEEIHYGNKTFLKDFFFFNIESFLKILKVLKLSSEYPDN